MYFNASWPELDPLSSRAMLDCLLSLGYRLPPYFATTFSRIRMEYFTQRQNEFYEYTTLRQLSEMLPEYGYAQPNPADLRKALDAMYAVTQPYWKLEDDTLATLAALRQKGLRLGLISNAGDALEVRNLLARLGLDSAFDQVLISAELGIRKPNPAIFQQALDYFAVPSSRAAMIGDTLGADILGAKHTGIYAIWITRRSHARPDNAAHLDTIQPDATISSLSELTSNLL